MPYTFEVLKIFYNLLIISTYTKYRYVKASKINTILTQKYRQKSARFDQNKAKSIPLFRHILRQIEWNHTHPGEERKNYFF